MAYAYQRTNYTDRRAQFSNGAYKDEKQYENQQVISVGLRYAYSKNWEIYGNWLYTNVDSNNEDQSVYQYSHTTHNYSVGVTLRF